MLLLREASVDRIVQLDRSDRDRPPPLPARALRERAAGPIAPAGRRASVRPGASTGGASVPHGPVPAAAARDRDRGPPRLLDGVDPLRPRAERLGGVDIARSGPHHGAGPRGPRRHGRTVRSPVASASLDPGARQHRGPPSTDPPGPVRRRPVLLRQRTRRATSPVRTAHGVGRPVDRGVLLAHHIDANSAWGELCRTQGVPPQPFDLGPPPMGALGVHSGGR